jgi:DNA-binding transcriptional MerR regulator
VDKAPDAFRTISEVAEDLDLPQHVLRFWETRFAQIKPMKRGGGRRYYRPEDVDVLRGIRHLLYSEGYTIRGVQRIFKDHGVKFVQTVWQAGAPQPAPVPGDVEEPGSRVAEERAESRRLFGILPLLSEGDRARDDESEHGDSDDEAESVSPAPASPNHRGAADPRGAVAAPQRAAAENRGLGTMPGPSAVPRAAALGREDMRKLQVTLAELTECRRLIDAALQEKA